MGNYFAKQLKGMKKVSNKWQGIIDFGERRLPRIFLRKVYIDGVTLWWSKWITHKDWNTAMERAEELENNINFD